MAKKSLGLTVALFAAAGGLALRGGLLRRGPAAPVGGLLRRALCGGLLRRGGLRRRGGLLRALRAWSSSGGGSIVL